jgi:hypothetical protein
MMPPTRCPARLRRLIAQANEKSNVQSHPLRLILRALHAWRQNKGPETLPLELPSQVTINLTDYSVTVRNELDLALKEVYPPSKIDLIRVCRICNDLFWAGRADKVVCDKHVELWRKRENRRKEKKRETEAKQVQASKQKQEEAKKTLSEMSRTAISVIRAVMRSPYPRLFEYIDHLSSAELRNSDELVRSTKVVRQTMNKLVRDGYLEYSESAERRNDRYDPTQKLRDLWADLE